MEPNEAGSTESVSVSVELTGEYDSVVRKLRVSDSGWENMKSVVDDLSTVLDTVARLDGGTRSAIAGRLPEDMAASYDAEAVIDALHVLKRYDLVVLEGNTWKPGPGLQARE